jgi:hypothetical protein
VHAAAVGEIAFRGGLQSSNKGTRSTSNHQAEKMTARLQSIKYEHIMFAQDERGYRGIDYRCEDDRFALSSVWKLRDNFKPRLASRQ